MLVFGDYERLINSLLNIMRANVDSVKGKAGRDLADIGLILSGIFQKRPAEKIAGRGKNGFHPRSAIRNV